MTNLPKYVIIRSRSRCLWDKSEGSLEKEVKKEEDGMRSEVEEEPCKESSSDERKPLPQFVESFAVGVRSVHLRIVPYVQRGRCTYY